MVTWGLGERHLEGGSMDKAAFDSWVQGYVAAWNSNEPDDIRALFTEGAEYLTEPYSSPWRGRDEIVREWLDNKDEPGETEFTYEIPLVQDDYAILKGRTAYKTPPREYHNLWEITLAPDGRATNFVEWWMKVPKEGES
jgi:uncharacterized protein (TIGR02246 family)